MPIDGRLLQLVVVVLTKLSHSVGGNNVTSTQLVNIPSSVGAVQVEVFFPVISQSSFP